MKIVETVDLGFRAHRVVQAHDLASFRQALADSPRPISAMAADRKSLAVDRAWFALVDTGIGLLGPATYACVDSRQNERT